MLPALSVLIDLQALDSAIDAARRRLAEFPVAEKAANDAVAAATAGLASARQTLAEATAARKLVEKDIAAVDTRLARFEEHKAAVKTNEQFHALQHEMAVGQDEKSTLELRAIEMMVAADQLAADVTAAEGRLADANGALAALRAAHAAEKGVLEAEIARLQTERAAKAPGVDKPTFARYEQVLKNRKGLAVAEMVKGHCTACHMGLRPAVESQIKRNEAIVQCDSCQRILFFVPPPAAAEPESSAL